MSPTREVRADGWCVRLGLSRQILRLEVPEAFAERGRRSAGPPLSPVLPLSEDGPVSAATLLMKAKQFDDGLVAAVELAVQNGAGHFAAKATLLRSLAETLAGRFAETSCMCTTAVEALVAFAAGWKTECREMEGAAARDCSEKTASFGVRKRV